MASIQITQLETDVKRIFRVLKTIFNKNTEKLNLSAIPDILEGKTADKINTLQMQQKTLTITSKTLTHQALTVADVIHGLDITNVTGVTCELSPSNNASTLYLGHSIDAEKCSVKLYNTSTSDTTCTINFIVFYHETVV